MKLVCIGDSLTYGYGVTRAERWTALVSDVMNGVEVINKGISGDTTGGMLARFEADVLREGADTVIIMGGSNDIFFAHSIAAAKSNIMAMVWRCLHENVQVRIGIPFPVIEEELAREWKPYAQGMEVQKQLEEYRKWLLEFGENFNIKTMDFWECLSRDSDRCRNLYLDGIHLNAAGHKEAADFVVRKNI